MPSAGAGPAGASRRLAAVVLRAQAGPKPGEAAALRFNGGRVEAGGLVLLREVHLGGAAVQLDGPRIVSPRRRSLGGVVAEKALLAGLVDASLPPARKG